MTAVRIIFASLLALLADGDLRTPGGWLATAWLLLLVFSIAIEIYVYENA